jgi:hypothetical protein
LARFQYGVLCGAATGFPVAIISIFIFISPHSSSGVGWVNLFGWLAALLGLVRGLMVSVQITKTHMIITNPVRTHRLLLDDLVGVGTATSQWGWAPTITARGQSKPLVLCGLSVPLWQFQTRRLGLLGTLRTAITFDGKRVPDETYRDAEQFRPLAAALSSTALHVPLNGLVSSLRFSPQPRCRQDRAH